MSKFVKKPVVIEAITFDEFVAYGKENAKELVDGMPWSFEYNGYGITHENDECYLIPTLEGTHNMTPKDMLITGVQGEIYPCKIDIFEATYSKEVETDYQDRVMKECSDLEEKTIKLYDFLKSEKVSTLTCKDYALLKTQYAFMNGYHSILIERIGDFN